MRFVSTSRSAKNTAKSVDSVSAKAAILGSTALDGGLYMPEQIPQLSAGLITELISAGLPAIAEHISKALFGDEFSDDLLRSVAAKAFTFDAPLVQLSPTIHALELFHGPTLAFKDFGARFLAQMVSHLRDSSATSLTVLVATSGDTGSAIANAFFNQPNIQVVVLYPSKQISTVQEKQITTLGGNISALEIQGNFDDCQRLVKTAFADQQLQKQVALTSANSINLARLVAQTFYYFHGFGQLRKVSPKAQIVVSVPSGNFGNLTAGLLAKRMGLPIARLIAATNANDVVPHYLETGKYSPRPSVSTLSNSMDVGTPSNFARLLSLYNHDLAAMRKDIWGQSYSDAATLAAIANVYQEFNYILDPHGAVAYQALKDYLETESSTGHSEDSLGTFLETAHPAKFPEVVTQVLPRTALETPDRLADYLSRESHSTILSASYDDLKSYLTSR